MIEFCIAAVIALVSFVLGRAGSTVSVREEAANLEAKRTQEQIEAIEDDLQGETPEQDISNRWNRIL